MCGRWVSQDEPDVSRYAFTSKLSSLEHKKVPWTNHAASTASMVVSLHQLKPHQQ
jgi:hypothetical protein